MRGSAYHRSYGYTYDWRARVVESTVLPSEVGVRSPGVTSEAARCSV